MGNLNSVHLIGRLTHEPDIRSTSTGAAVASISLAVSRYYKTEQGEKKEETEFIEVSSFGKTAELMRDYLHKGEPVFIAGRLKLSQWDDRETGKKRQKLSVICDRMEFLGSKNEGATSSRHASQASVTSPAGRTKPAPDFSKPPVQYNSDGDPEDITF